MKKTYIIEGLGKVEVNHSFWSGRFMVYVDNDATYRLTKRCFTLGEGDNKKKIYIYGNMFSGLTLGYGANRYVITKPLPWFYYVLCFFPFAMTMVLGSLGVLAEMGFYYVGGAIGGGISGGLSAASLFTVAYLPKWWMRVLVALAFIAVTFGICLGIGNAIVNAARR